MPTVNAQYFDGLSARQQAVILIMADGLLEIHADGLLREVPLSQVSISTKLGNTPRLLHFSDGGHCEVKEHAAFEAMLAGAEMPTQSAISSIEGNWRHAISATLFAIVLLIASFYWGLPLFANFVAERIPANIALKIDEHFLQAVDLGLMQPSKLDTARQSSLQQRFKRLLPEQGHPAYTLIFRHSERVGANAFALPGGTIIATDQLVKLAANDEEIIAVLAHELGHVSERHSLRQLLQSSVIGLALTWYVGDVSSLLALAPTVILQSSYSRNFERRADQYAANLLRQNNISPARLADMLGKIETAHLGEKEQEQRPSPFLELFSTHPDTDERMRNLRD